MTKGIKIKDLVVGTGDEATEQSVVVANVREFLRRGDEVRGSPLFGTKRLIDLGRRESIAGLRYGIPGMRVGGTREITISPHLAYGEVGVPGRIPADALLRCQVELLEIRRHNALLPEDWLPGKILIMRQPQSANDPESGWTLVVHEGGNSCLTRLQKLQGKRQKQVCASEVPIALDTDESRRLIVQAMGLEDQMPEACVGWNSGFIDVQGGGAKDRRDGTPCMVIHVLERGADVCLFGVRENSQEFRDCEFFQAVKRLIEPHVGNNPAAV